ncbi:MAG: DUF1109 domain-containing protein [Gammaproteobacteria bacterium]
MKTDDLIEMLARQAGAAPRQPVVRTLAAALVAGALLSLALVGVLKTPVPAAFWLTLAPWIKLLYGAALAAAALWWVGRSARPGVAQRPAQIAVSVVLTAMLSLAVLVWIGTPAPERLATLMGTDPLGCIRNVALSALPVAAALCVALRRVAPTQLRSAGAAAGLAAGAVGSVVYSLTCTETGIPFTAVWYTAGMVVVAGLGALLGPRLLRW